MIEREKLQHLIENIGIPKLCLILLLGIRPDYRKASHPGRQRRTHKALNHSKRRFYRSLCEKTGEAIGQCIKTCRRSRQKVKVMITVKFIQRSCRK